METVNAVTDAWQPYFTAQSAAAAALAGLVFVGLSLNLQRILTLHGVAARAFLTLSLLMIILVVSSLMLIPHVPLPVVGAGTLGLGLLAGIKGTATLLRVRGNVPGQSQRNFISNMALFECAVWPYVIGGLLLVAGHLHGLYWVAAAIIVSFMKALVDAWVLLVEINR